MPRIVDKTHALFTMHSTTHLQQEHRRSAALLLAAFSHTSSAKC
jgi:hypothetical protein